MRSCTLTKAAAPHKYKLNYQSSEDFFMNHKIVVGTLLVGASVSVIAAHIENFTCSESSPVHISQTTAALEAAKQMAVEKLDTNSWGILEQLNVFGILKNQTIAKHIPCGPTKTKYA